jgi:hypothetical protein
MTTKQRPKPLRFRQEARQDAKELARLDHQFQQGRAYELMLARQYLAGPKATGIGSGVEAARALERMEHRR